MSKTANHVTLTLCRGLPASGKTSWAIEQVRRSFGGTVRVNRDEIKKSCHGVNVFTGADKNAEEKLLTKIQISMVRGYLAAKKNVIVDDMNLSMRPVDAFYDLVQEFEGAVQLRFQDFEVDIKTCIKRDAERGKNGHHSVGEDEIRAISKRHLGNGSSLPELPAKYYELIQPVPPLKQDSSLPKAWMIDLDGTLAKLATDRGYYDWDRVDEDDPIEHAVELVRALHATGSKIIIVSGRDAVCQDQTRDWLETLEIPFNAIFMRPIGDSRGDEIVKAEIYHEHIEGKYYVSGVLDDRDKVVQMWRSKGLFVAQVAPGLF